MTVLRTIGDKRLLLELAPAVLLGAATLFFCGAMPAVLFERIVIAAGLPDLIAAATPPLGNTARITFGLAAALLATAMAWGLLRLADHWPAERRDLYGEEEGERYVPPASRDEPAPRRRPISAMRDLGEPAGPAESPAFRAIPAAADWSEPLEPAADAPEAAPIQLHVFDPPRERAAFVAEPLELIHPMPEAEPAGAAHEVEEAVFEELPEDAAPEDTAPEDIGDDILDLDPEQAVAPDATPETIAALMARLEAGLLSRSSRPPAANPLTDELREAIGDLQRFTGRRV